MFRVGGEEFCLVATATDAEQVRTLAEKIRQVVESYSFPVVGRVTISIGIAYFRKGDTRQNIFACADSAMYLAKARGRNCVLCNDWGLSNRTADRNAMARECPVIRSGAADSR